MPKIKSAIKRVDVAERNRERNRSWKTAIRTVRTSVVNACKAGDKAAAEAALDKAYSIIDRAVSKGVEHDNAAARRKSRLAALLNKLSA